MLRLPHGAAALALFASIGTSAALAATPAAPHGPHPRIALDARTRETLKAKLKVRGSAVAAAVEACRAAKTSAGTPSGYQGDAWAFGASACGLAYQLTGDRGYADRGVRLWRALLEDVDTIGDQKACVAGAPPERALAAIRRDTGYAIRFIGPHAALAYDWLHDAPGVTEALRQQSRTCFFAWSDWYTRDGYLHNQPGANYHAGFAIAKTLIAVATAGEGADPSDPIWREVIEDLFGRQLLTNGLAADTSGIPSGGFHGALVGGDWAEGWQYGPLSVLEYAFAARTLEEQGVSLPEMQAWAGDLTRRYLHARTPSGDRMYIGGDFEGEEPHAKPNSAPLLATLLAGTKATAAWAAFLRGGAELARTGTPAWDALGEAVSVAPADPLAPASARSTWYLARGTRNLYARSNWSRDAVWAVFTSAPRQVSDHQHPDASNFVFSRGADALIVDPSPYGTRSTLTGNALTVDSAVVGTYYRPSQTAWSEADLPWARGTLSGVVAARADLARAFNFNGTRSDVRLARRDWVLLPEGEIVVIDRAAPVGPGQSAYLRFRTPAKLVMESGIARGKVGASALAIHLVSATPQAVPEIHAVPQASECTDPKAFGACTIARFAVGEYAMKLTGPEVLAVHVLDALGADEPPARVAPLGNGVVGASVTRGKQQTFVVEPADAEAPDRLSYAVPGGVASRHVVFDAPVNSAGQTRVVAESKGDRCALTLVAAQGGGGEMIAAPAIFTVGTAATGCAVADDAPLAMDGGDGPRPAASGLALPSAEPRSKMSGGCGCALSRVRHKKPMLALGAFVALLILIRARRRRPNTSKK